MPITHPPFTEEDRAKLDGVLAQEKDAKEIIERATRAGIDVTHQAERLAAATKGIRGIKQQFFPAT